jgi:hypothetical protein
MTVGFVIGATLRGIALESLEVDPLRLESQLVVEP